ncbi:MAG TPA: ATP-dependent DNA ligase [Methylomirabilota bacterium]|nr:ATP-dependent DNA ligase [Methylomirabilota bacterium]
MEARLVDAIPDGPGWQYEPKWDGFRCLAFRDGDAIALQSKSGQALARYFPELVAHLRTVRTSAFVLDGEIVVPVDGHLSFDDLLQRIHPAASRIERLSRERPAVLIVFDLLVDPAGRSLIARPLAERRRALEAFAAKHLAGHDDIRLSPATEDAAQARAWLSMTGATLDGIVAKRLDLPYQSGERTGMQKVKRRRTVDCVVGGFRYASGARVVGSLLLGLYDRAGLLHHVGFTSGFPTATRKTLLDELRPLIEPPGFTGRAPGGPSRWSRERSGEWEPLRPELVVEVSYDHFAGDRFRHATRFLRWRPDKAPRQCTLAQVSASSRAPDPPGSAAAPPPGSAGGSRRRAPSTSRRSSAGSRRRAGRR